MAALPVAGVGQILERVDAPALNVDLRLPVLLGRILRILGRDRVVVARRFDHAQHRMPRGLIHGDGHGVAAAGPVVIGHLECDRVHPDGESHLGALARGDLRRAFFPDIAGDRAVRVARRRSVERHRLAAVVVGVGDLDVQPGVGHRRGVDLDVDCVAVGRSVVVGDLQRDRVRAGRQTDLWTLARGDLRDALFPDIAGDCAVRVAGARTVESHAFATGGIAVVNQLVAAGVGHGGLVGRHLDDVDDELPAASPRHAVGQGGVIIVVPGIELHGVESGPRLRAADAAVRIRRQARLVIEDELAPLSQTEGTVVAGRATNVALGTLGVPCSVAARLLFVDGFNKGRQKIGADRIDGPDFPRDGVTGNVLVIDRPIPGGAAERRRPDDNLDRRQQIARHNTGRTVDVGAVIEVGCLAGLGIGNGERRIVAGRGKCQPVRQIDQRQLASEHAAAATHKLEHAALATIAVVGAHVVGVAALPVAGVGQILERIDAPALDIDLDFPVRDARVGRVLGGNRVIVARGLDDLQRGVGQDRRGDARNKHHRGTQRNDRPHVRPPEK